MIVNDYHYIKFQKIDVLSVIFEISLHDIKSKKFEPVDEKING